MWEHQPDQQKFEKLLLSNFCSAEVWRRLWGALMREHTPGTAAYPTHPGPAAASPADSEAAAESPPPTDSDAAVRSDPFAGSRAH